MSYGIVHGDITKIEADAIVNAANSALQRGSGVCGAIFAAAGARELQVECNQIGHCDTGRAVLTKAYGLNAKYIIHTVGPIWRGGDHHEEVLLRSCYIHSLRLAAENGCRSIAFPLISSGIYGYPKEEALRVAEKAIQEFLHENGMEIKLVIFDRDRFPMDEDLQKAIDRYMARNLIPEYPLDHTFGAFEQSDLELQEPLAERSMDYDLHDKKKRKGKRSLEDAFKELDESFSERLLRLIDERGRTDVEVYKGANLDRKLFSKIRKGNGYQPSKSTAIALSLSLQLNLDDTLDLLKTAGFTLSGSSRSDVIVQFFIERENFDIFAINHALFTYEEKLLGV